MNEIELNQLYNGHKPVAVIGRGRSTVLDAFNEAGERRVIKIFDHCEPGHQFNDRQRAAIRTMSSGTSKAITRVFGMGRDPRGFMFLIMEYIEGQQLGKTEFSEQDAVNKVLDFCLELEKIAPTDSLPRWFENSDIMVTTKGGGLVLVDHPILRVENRVALDHAQHPQGQFRDISMVNPEALQGKKTTPLSLIYSLACLLIYLCKGRGPFVGRNLVETACMHISSQPQLSLANDQLRAVLLSCLEKDPTRRLNSVTEFREAVAASVLA